jgi:hypothetical protein
MVIRYVPAARLQDVTMVTTDDACPFGGGVTVAGENVIVVPEGAPNADRLTGLLNPFTD